MSTSGSRLIPAHAGKTIVSVAVWVSGSAHPRSRGENLKQVALDVNKAGSSPLTRGKLDTIIRERDREGLIPAHAGKTVV